MKGKDWNEAVQTYLVAYRNTPHPSTGVCPSELLFRRTFCTKLPGLRGVAKLDEEVRDRGQEKKIKMKEYSDSKFDGWRQSSVKATSNKQVDHPV